MNCDRCGKPAVVHEICQQKGQKREVHLCEEHAREAGYLMREEGGVADQLAAAALEGVTVPPAPGSAGGAPGKGKVKPKVAGAVPCCECCRMTFHQFRQTGLLGCADCYKAFGDALATLIEKTQSAAVHHVGKTPRRRREDIDLGMLRQRLARELDEAVRAEQYERAAKLRDRLLTLVAGPAAETCGVPESAERAEPEVPAPDRLDSDSGRGDAPKA